MVICSFFCSLVSWSENLQSISVWRPTSINHCAWLHSYVICVWKSEEEETLNLYMFQHMEMVKISVFSLGCQIQILSAISFILPNLSFYLFLQGLHNTPFFFPDSWAKKKLSTAATRFLRRQKNPTVTAKDLHQDLMATDTACTVRRVLNACLIRFNEIPWTIRLESLMKTLDGAFVIFNTFLFTWLKFVWKVIISWGKVFFFFFFFCLVQN